MSERAQQPASGRPLILGPNLYKDPLLDPSGHRASAFGEIHAPEKGPAYGFVRVLNTIYGDKKLPDTPEEVAAELRAATRLAENTASRDQFFRLAHYVSRLAVAYSEQGNSPILLYIQDTGEEVLSTATPFQVLHRGGYKVPGYDCQTVVKFSELHNQIEDQQVVDTIQEIMPHIEGNHSLFYNFLGAISNSVDLVPDEIRRHDKHYTQKLNALIAIYSKKMANMTPDEISEWLAQDSAEGMLSFAHLSAQHLGMKRKSKSNTHITEAIVRLSYAPLIYSLYGEETGGLNFAKVEEILHSCLDKAKKDKPSNPLESLYTAAAYGFAAEALVAEGEASEAHGTSLVKKVAQRREQLRRINLSPNADPLVTVYDFYKARPGNPTSHEAYQIVTVVK